MAGNNNSGSKQGANLKVRFATGTGEKVSMAELSRITGTNITTLKKLCREGAPHTTNEDGTYSIDTAEFIHWKLQQEVDKAKGFTQESRMSIEDARRRREVALALQAEIDLNEKMGLLMPIQDQLQLFGKALATVRAKLVSMPNRISGRLQYQDEKVIRSTLEKEINQMLEEFSDYPHDTEH